MALQKINPHDFEWQIILNPYALSSQCIQYKEHIAFELERNQIPHRFHVSERKEGTSREVASKLCQEGQKHFLIVGGDGTINEIINGIFQSGVDTSDIYVAIFPFGTGNDFCRTHLYPTDFASTMEHFLDPSFVRHDVGMVKSVVNDENVGQRYFINIAGFGFDAAIIKNTNGTKPKYFASAIYLTNLLKVLFKHKAQNIHIQGDGLDVSSNVFSIAVGNCKYNGNGMMQVPMAKPNDGKFDVVVINRVSPFKVIRNVKNLYAGKHIGALKEIATYQASQLSIQSQEHVLGEVEGEMLKQGRYDISILPQAINIMTMRTDL